MLQVTIDICTKDRYFSTLPLTLMSIANQTLRPKKVIIYDDSTDQKDIRDIETIRYILQTFDEKGIGWRVLNGRKMGQHWGHQIVQDMAQTPFVLRVDDDCVLEPNCLEILCSHMKDGVGAVGGRVAPPGVQKREMPPNLISNIQSNCQWFVWDGVKSDNEHLYGGCYLYRRGIQGFETTLSRKAFREETLHTYGLFKKGYKLIIDPKAITYHYQSQNGGIRSEKGEKDTQQQYWHDEMIFQETLREYEGKKLILLDSGRGDHLVFKMAILPKLKEKYKELTLAVCYPDMFEGEKCIGVTEELKFLYGDKHNISKYMHDVGHKTELKYAYAAMYGVEI